MLSGSKIVLAASLLTLGCAQPVLKKDDTRDAELERKKHGFATYFNTIKSQVAANWDPTGLDPQGTKFGLQSRYTRVRADLDADGALIDIAIKEKSGVDVLDELAVSAFRAAAPFPRAPHQLVIDGRVRFCFVFQVGSPNQRPDAQADIRNRLDNLQTCSQ
jgi:TonB family protein